MSKPTPSTVANVARLGITLDYVDPKVTRRIEVPL